jgi:hypothetical protein
MEGIAVFLSPSDRRRIMGLRPTQEMKNSFGAASLSEPPSLPLVIPTEAQRSGGTCGIPMPGDPDSVLTADALLGEGNARYLCVVRDPHARFPALLGFAK